MDVEAFSFNIVIVGMIAVHGKHRKNSDQVQALTEYVRQRDIIRVLVIVVQRQNTSRKRIHHILRRGLHNDIPYKILRQGTLVCQKDTEVIQFFLLREPAEKQKIRRLLKTEPVLTNKSLCQIVNVDPTVI